MQAKHLEIINQYIQREIDYGHKCMTVAKRNKLTGSLAYIQDTIDAHEALKEFLKTNTGPVAT